MPSYPETYGIMFHHFYSDIHPKGQGAISGEELEALIAYLKESHEILTANDYQNRIASRTILENDICLTFDDALLCQVDVALPVLTNLGIKAFFFVYSSAFSGNPDPLEIYRYFRTTEFDDFESFFGDFIVATRQILGDRADQAMESFVSDEYLIEFPFYSLEDRLFRFIRDQVLSTLEYKQVMNGMMTNIKFDPAEVIPKVFMSASHLKSLQAAGHIVGLHSDTHPTKIHQMPRERQLEEYHKNSKFLHSTLGSVPSTMSHPCGNYNSDTLSILKSLEVNLGFRSSRTIREIHSPLEIPREDHTNLLARMNGLQN